MPSESSGSTAPSDDTVDAARRPTVGRRQVLAGIGVGVAAGAVGSTAATAGASPVDRSRDPTTVWQASPTESEIAALQAGDGVVAARTADAFVGLDPTDGRRRWRRSIDTSGTELLTHRGRTYLNGGGTLLALADDGTVRWRFDPEPNERATLDIGFRGDRCYVSVNLPGERRLLALSIADGQQEWTVEGPDTSLVHLTDDVVVALTEPLGYDVEGRDLVGYDRTDGTELWRYELGDVGQYSFAVSRDTVFLGYDGQQYAIAAADGTVRWSRSDTFGVFVEYAGITYLFTREQIVGLAADGTEQWTVDVDGLTYPVGRLDDGLAVLSAASVSAVAPDGTRRWQYEFQGDRNTRTARAVAGTTFVADGGALYRIESGDRTWSFDPDDGSPATLAVGDGRLYAADSGTVYAVDPDADGGPTTTATARPGTTAADGSTTAGTESATAAAGTATAGDGTPGETTAADAETTTESGSGSNGSPGFGVLTVLAAALLGALRLLRDDDEDR